MSFSKIQASDEVDLDKEQSRLYINEGYVAKDIFVVNTSWVATSYFGLRTLCDGNGINPLNCTVVGVISKDVFKLDSHGDFNPTNKDKTSSSQLSEALYRFSLTRPEGSFLGIFTDDFDLFIKQLKLLVEVIPFKHKTTARFFEEIGGRPTFHFTRKIFERLFEHPQTTLFPPNNEDFSLRSYEVRPHITEYLNAIQRTHHARSVEILDKQGEPIEPRQREHFLIDRLVEVTFNLEYNTLLGLKSQFHAIKVLV